MPYAAINLMRTYVQRNDDQVTEFKTAAIKIIIIDCDYCLKKGSK